MFEGFRQLDIQTTGPHVENSYSRRWQRPAGMADARRSARAGSPASRAAAGIDLEMDTQDFEAGRKINRPLLVIVGGRSHTSKFCSFGDAWSKFASNLVRCIALPCGHYRAEQDLEGTHRELDFLQSDAWLDALIKMRS